MQPLCDWGFEVAATVSANEISGEQIELSCCVCMTCLTETLLDTVLVFRFTPIIVGLPFNKKMLIFTIDGKMG